MNLINAILNFIIIFRPFDIHLYGYERAYQLNLQSLKIAVSRNYYVFQMEIKKVGIKKSIAKKRRMIILLYSSFFLIFKPSFAYSEGDFPIYFLNTLLK